MSLLNKMGNSRIHPYKHKKAKRVQLVNPKENLDGIFRTEQRKLESKFYEDQRKVLLRIRKHLLDQKRRLKAMKKATKKFNRELLVSRLTFKRNTLRRWPYDDQEEMLEHVAEQLLPMVTQLYGQTFHFHLVEPTLNQCDLCLCWEQPCQRLQKEFQQQRLQQLQQQHLQQQHLQQQRFFQQAIQPSISTSSSDEEDEVILSSVGNI